jgi:peptidoglycan/xylan/chitin deacetylase (PgdA/CDA1 family)
MGLIRLSFDDGPKPLLALEKILGTLEQHAIKADFYLNGVEVDESDATRKAAKKIGDKGHKVENHAWSHKRLDTMPLEEVRKEVSDTQAVIKKVTEKTPTRLRPPFGAGAFSKPVDPELAAIAKEQNLTITIWNVDTEDWKRPKGLKQKMKSIMDQVGKNKHRELIDILMHVQAETADDLEVLIGKLKSDGYQFG